MINKKKEKGKIFKNTVLICLIFCFVNIIIFAIPNKVEAGFLDGIGEFLFGSDVDVGALQDELDDINSVKTISRTEVARLEKQIKDANSEWTWEKVKEAWKIKNKDLSSIFYKNVLGHFLNTLAYDTAVFLVTGNAGHMPMFEEEGWGGYLKNISDNTAGSAIEAWGREGPLKFNLCEPDFGVRVKIGLGLQQIARPKAPACTFSKMKENWEEELRKPNFLNDFQDIFNPWSNDLGIALSIQTGIENQISDRLNERTNDRLEGQGVKAVRDPISGRIKTPVVAVRRLIELPIDKSTGKEEQFTGTIADAIDVFANTLLGKIMEKWFKEGLVINPIDNSYDWDNGFNFEYQTERESVASSKERFRNLIEPEFSVRGDYKILNELIMCNDPTKAGPTNCVITQNFRQAIDNRMTVGKAMDQGFLNPNGIFGFTSDGLEPDYYDEGYPYRSMIILRKFRILPVGWELASQYIKDNISETLSLKDLVSCYSSNDNYDGYDAGWCQGLVDPSWVLKAPLNYCKREGYGPEIISEQIIGKGHDSKLAISRNDNYCADEQSCIKENNDGSCQLYGYCTEEMRKWAFNANSCESRYNTCQTFRASNGTTASYLENTLNYGVCNINNVGCKSYCTNYDYQNNKWGCNSVEDNNQIYFNKNVEECEQEFEGCHEFIRAKSGLGVNVLINSSFESDLAGSIWDDGLSVQVEDGFNGLKSLSIPNNFEKSIQIGSNAFSIMSQAYSLSFYAKDCGAGSFKINEQNESIKLKEGTGWQYNTTSYNYPKMAIGNEISFSINHSSSDCIIDAVKLERGASATAYSDYRDKGLVYLKVAPDYLDCNGVDDPIECDNFIGKCGVDDEGCEFYFSTIDNIGIPAKIISNDYCPSECVGYDVFMQRETRFNSSSVNYFIPSTAKSCGLEASGCDEWTNLDEISQGGESIEYYSYLRQCIKPSNNTDCAEFYTWEGSSESGFQLRVHILKNNNGEPALFETETKCSKNIYNLLADEPEYNSDCREFFNTSGQVSYHLYANTITCSEDCHPYRRTEKNIDFNLDKVTCKVGGNGDDNYLKTKDNQFKWDHDLGVCYFCKSGGEWNLEHNTCIYNAIQSECIECSANEKGCREYDGNTGSNMMIVLNNDFEGNLYNWEGFDSTTATLSSEELTAGGESLLVTKTGAVTDNSRSIKATIGHLARANSSYVLSFLAKSYLANNKQATKIDLIQFVNEGDEEVDFSTVEIGADWRMFKVNLSNLNHEISEDEKLVIKANGDFYIDDIRLTEIVDRYYLIKDSWKMPKVDGKDICNWDIVTNAPHSLYSLGCEKYIDRDNNVHFLHNFNELCKESVVGCELMIDTHNYSDNNLGIWNGVGDSSCEVDESDCAKINADNYVYAVYDPEKQCNQSDKGCQKLGLPYQYDNLILYNNIYLKNNPDNYNEILCLKDETNCEAWTSLDGNSYFKNPRDMICEWRQGYQDGWGWWNKKIKRCDDGSGNNIAIVNGKIDFDQEKNICLDNNDCGLVNISQVDGCENNNDCRINKCEGGFCSNTNDSCLNNDECVLLNQCINDKCYYSCIQDTNDYSCENDQNSIPRTIGYGGSGAIVPQSKNGWVGICSTSEAGCSEYIDPISEFSNSLIFNSNFAKIAGIEKAGWACNSTICNQDIKAIEPNTLYIAKGNINSINCRDIDGDETNIYKLDSSNNKLDQGNTSISVDGDNSVRFFSSNSEFCKVEINQNMANISNIIEIKKAIIDYQIKQDLDKTSCNGIVNFGEGCILFNERVQDGDNLASLIWDSSVGDGNPVVCAGDNCDSNILLQVMPDRVCDKWLACRSFIKDENDNNVCFDVGLCDSVDDNGNCNGFVIINENDKINQTYNTKISIGQIGNMSGYVKVGHSESSLNTDYYPLGAMEQEGQVAEVSNGNFEIEGSNSYPVGWSWEDSSGKQQIWDKDIFKIINNPIEAQTEGIGYAPEGSKFLKLGSIYSATSEFINVEPNTDYILTAYINTLNLSEGIVSIKIEQFDNKNNLITINNNITYLDSGNKWTYKLAKFITLSSIAKIKITLHAQNNASSAPIGNFYFDDLRIRPALNSKEIWWTTQSCRLYPENDSLACDYYEDSGKRKKGWLGYCLEYDSYPGSKDNCILWWPVDKVKGEGVEEGGGYADRFPLYYCSQFTSRDFVLVEKRVKAFIAFSPAGGDDSECPSYHCSGKGCDGNHIECPDGYGGHGCDDGLACPDQGGCPDGYCECDEETSSGRSGSDNEKRCIPFGEVSACGKGWYPYDGDLQNFGGVRDRDSHNENSEEYGLKLCDIHSGELFDPEDFPEFFYCKNLVKTVTSVGQNKNWAGRTYQGSNYIVPQLEYGYTAGYKPFGALVSPFPSTNPYEWDSIQNTDFDKDIEPLFVKTFAKPENYVNEVNAGSPYSCSGGCSQAGLCSETRSFCYNIEIAEASPNAIAPTNFKNPFACPTGEECEEFPVQGIYNGNRLIKRLFAESYGNWEWVGNRKNGRYEKSTEGWSVPETACKETGIAPRPAFNASGASDLCGIMPIINNIEVNNKNSNIELKNSQFINLTFNSHIDSQQLPLVMYSINWGDNESTVVSGVEMRGRSNLDNPHSLYHLYSYWDLKAKHSVDQENFEDKKNTIYCGNADSEAKRHDNDGSGYTCVNSACCIVKPKIKIKDNWGWCNGGIACDSWEKFKNGTVENWIIINEK